MATTLTTDYYRDLVTTETNKFKILCHQWTQTMDNEPDITEEAVGHIRSTIGKTNLFINQRFKQFSGLIDDCEMKRGVKETKVEDLQGFWEMIYFQILDLHQSFERLNQLKDNKWTELEVKPKDVPKAAPNKRVIKVLPKHTSKPIVRSKIREQIQNMRNKSSEQLINKNESFGEKENQKIDTSNKTLEVKKLETIVDKQSDNSITCVKNTIKRTPLKMTIKK
ncbi:disks large-associated protein 5-like [Oppia nitens]|uniref:disks large-associated protein 5-like n=1 Tax=Oppia nitens TaxID=1686743 RepID=UPI0023D9A00D|nr:disks large-associated protein 5-like [Oppia nitens]